MSTLNQKTNISHIWRDVTKLRLNLPKTEPYYAQIMDNLANILDQVILFMQSTRNYPQTTSKNRIELTEELETLYVNIINQTCEVLSKLNHKPDVYKDENLSLDQKTEEMFRIFESIISELERDPKAHSNDHTAPRVAENANANANGSNLVEHHENAANNDDDFLSANENPDEDHDDGSLALTNESMSTISNLSDSSFDTANDGENSESEYADVLDNTIQDAVISANDAIQQALDVTLDQSTKDRLIDNINRNIEALVDETNPELVQQILSNLQSNTQFLKDIIDNIPEEDDIFYSENGDDASDVFFDTNHSNNNPFPDNDDETASNASSSLYRSATMVVTSAHPENLVKIEELIVPDTVYEKGSSKTHKIPDVKDHIYAVIGTDTEGNEYAVAAYTKANGKTKEQQRDLAKATIAAALQNGAEQPLTITHGSRENMKAAFMVCEQSKILYNMPDPADKQYTIFMEAMTELANLGDEDKATYEISNVGVEDPSANIAACRTHTLDIESKMNSGIRNTLQSQVEVNKQQQGPPTTPKFR